MAKAKPKRKPKAKVKKFLTGEKKFKRGTKQTATIKQAKIKIRKGETKVNAYRRARRKLGFRW